MNFLQRFSLYIKKIPLRWKLLLGGQSIITVFIINNRLEVMKDRKKLEILKNQKSIEENKKNDESNF